MPVTHIFTLIIPDLWGNPAVYNYFGKSDYKDSIMFIGVPLIFSIISIFKQKGKDELFFIGSIIISFILARDNPLSKLIISSPMPVLSSFLPNRIFLITTFSFCVISAYGLDYILGEKKAAVFPILKKTFISLSIIIIVLILFVTLPILKNPALMDKVDEAGINISADAIRFKNTMIPMIFFLITIGFFVFKNKYSKNIFFFTIIAVLFSQSYLFAQKYIPFSNRQFIYPSHPVFTYLKENQKLDRFMSVGFGHIVPSIPYNSVYILRKE